MGSQGQLEPKAIVLGAFGELVRRCYALKKGGTYVVIRDPQVALHLLTVRASQLQSHYDADLLVNALPVGMSLTLVSPSYQEGLTSLRPEMRD